MKKFLNFIKNPKFKMICILAFLDFRILESHIFVVLESLFWDNKKEKPPESG